MKESSLELKHLGNRLFVSKKYQEARKYFEQLIEKEPLLVDGYIGKAKSLERLGEYELVVELLENVKNQFDSLHLLGLLGDAHRVLANRGKIEHIEPAVFIYEEYLRKKDDAVRMFYLAEIYELRKLDYQSALNLYVKSLEIDARNREAVLGVRECLIKLKRLDEFSQFKTKWD